MNVNEPTTSCCVCYKEIPLDAAFTPEGAEYVEHFCGLECYQRFQARSKAVTETSADPNACELPPSGRVIRKSVSPAPHAARITSLPKHAPDRALSRSF